MLFQNHVQVKKMSISQQKDDKSGLVKSYKFLFYLPAFFIKPWSARIVWQSSQVKHSTCQLLFIAFITRPDIKVLHFPQQGANKT